jgi:transposase-like protein
MVLERERDHPSRWAAVVSIAEKIGCVPQTLHQWVKKAEVDTGMRAGVTAKLNDVDPQAWLADVLARIAEHPAQQLDALLPWNWKAQAARLAA